jgi:hypothetical protein
MVISLVSMLAYYERGSRRVVMPEVLPGRGEGLLCFRYRLIAEKREEPLVAVPALDEAMQVKTSCAGEAIGGARQ